MDVNEGTNIERQLDAHHSGQADRQRIQELHLNTLFNFPLHQQ